MADSSAIQTFDQPTTKSPFPHAAPYRQTIAHLIAKQTYRITPPWTPAQFAVEVAITT